MTKNDIIQGSKEAKHLRSLCVKIPSPPSIVRFLRQETFCIEGGIFEGLKHGQKMAGRGV